jgi:hypothetical protein
MIFLRLQLIWVFTLTCGLMQEVALSDEREERVRAGKQFLSDSRIDQWDKYFSEGLPKMGKITKKGKPIPNSKIDVGSESWMEKEYMLVSTHDVGKSIVRFSNPDYSAMIESRNGKYKILNVDRSIANLPYVPIEGIPFAVCSSVNFSRETIPQYLKQGKLKISDYRLEDHKHFVDLEFVDEPDRGIIELIFYEDNPSMLPNEAIQKMGTPHSRHYISSDFVAVSGYHIPLSVQNKNSDDFAKVEVSPQELLDRNKCRLSFYGLPEPGQLAVADFGKDRISWRTIVICVLVAIATIITIVMWFRGKFSGAN